MTTPGRVLSAKEIDQLDAALGPHKDVAHLELLDTLRAYQAVVVAACRYKVAIAEIRRLDDSDDWDGNWGSKTDLLEERDSSLLAVEESVSALPGDEEQTRSYE